MQYDTLAPLRLEVILKRLLSSPIPNIVKKRTFLKQEETAREAISS
ncbi:hypothetical protein [Flavobacterium sp. TAB 87]